MEADYVEYSQTNGSKLSHADLYFTDTKSSSNGAQMSHDDIYFTETKPCSILGPVTVERSKEVLYNMAGPDGGTYTIQEPVTVERSTVGLYNLGGKDVGTFDVEGEGKTRMNFCVINKKKIMSLLFVIILGGALGAGVGIGTCSWLAKRTKNADIGVATNKPRKGIY